jgi:hypothetical protein
MGEIADAEDSGWINCIYEQILDCKGIGEARLANWEGFDSPNLARLLED